jgi:hypothetical protein
MRWPRRFRRGDVVGKLATIAKPEAHTVATQPQQAQQQAGAVVTLQIDDQIVASRPHLPQPGPDLAEPVVAVAPIHGENLLKPGVVRKKQVTPGGLGIKVDFTVGKSPEDILEQGSGDDHVSQGAPLDDQDTANSRIGGQIGAVTHGEVFRFRDDKGLDCPVAAS